MKKLIRTNPNIISSPDDSLLTLPFDLIPEILSRLPVKSLLQFRCVCKSWKTLISDPKFAKKHLNLSNIRRSYHVSCSDNQSSTFILNSYSLQSIFTDTNNNFTKLEFPLNISSEWHTHRVVGSCDGILCVANCLFTCYVEPLAVLWNPSIRKYKELPPFENPPVNRSVVAHGFGYDHVSHDYKLVVLYQAIDNGSLEDPTNAKVYSLSSDSWRSIQPFPLGTLCDDRPAIYVSGAINWLAFSKPGFQRIIVSLDLGKESYQKILLHEHEHKEISGYLKLCVLKDWLGIIFDHDVWVMKEYGVKESWTKLFSFSYLLDPPTQSFYLTNVLYIFEDDQVLLMFKKDSERKLIVYNFKNDTCKVTFVFQDISQVYVESLISPCS